MSCERCLNGIESNSSVVQLLSHDAFTTVSHNVTTVSHRHLDPVALVVLVVECCTMATHKKFTSASQCAASAPYGTCGPSIHST
jgi:hypothetical protein